MISTVSTSTTVWTANPVYFIAEKPTKLKPEEDEKKKKDDKLIEFERTID